VKVLLTGAAGFIGFHTARALLAQGDTVIGLDNLNEYYDPALKRARLAQLDDEQAFRFIEADVADRVVIQQLFDVERPQRVVHLAAQAGVRYGLTHPQAYIDSNIVGFANILEGCRAARVEHLVYASSSSVYGANTKMPFSEHDITDHPISLYGATKKSNELMAHAYAHLYGLPVTGLRFFTVYGPWGRPDMALFKFTQNILTGEPIEIYNHGHHARDFTYIDDVVDSVLKTLAQPASGDLQWDGDKPDPATSSAPSRLYNIGNNQPISLLDFISSIEKACGQPAIKTFVDLQPGDVPKTFADIDDLSNATGFQPSTPLAVGVEKFVFWYRDYYKI
jgi:UDP-glucuronate 4-epimerase